MPCGSRARRNRRNRHHKQIRRPFTPPIDEPSRNQLVEVSEEEHPEESQSTNREATFIGDSGEVVAAAPVPGKLPCLENMSTARSRLIRGNNRCKIEKKVMSTDTQICEITTIRNASPHEARLDHIPGVGIVESSLPGKECRSTRENPSSLVTITEPIETLLPLSKVLADKVDDLAGSEDCRTVAVPTKSPLDFLEIREMTESDAELDNVSDGSQRTQQQGIVSEAESDLDRDSTVGERRTEGTSEDEAEEIMSWETERELRSFIEGLKLPKSPLDASLSTAERASNSRGATLAECDSRRCPGGRDETRGTSKYTAGKCAPAAAATATTTSTTTTAALGVYQSQMSLESNRCLGIIREEIEGRGADGVDRERQHIRDFINEEIGKYRRECRDRRSNRRYDAQYEIEGGTNVKMTENVRAGEKSAIRLNEDEAGRAEINRFSDCSVESNDKAKDEDGTIVSTNTEYCDIDVEIRELENDVAEDENETRLKCKNGGDSNVDVMESTSNERHIENISTGVINESISEKNKHEHLDKEIETRITVNSNRVQQEAVLTGLINTKVSIKSEENVNLNNIQSANEIQPVQEKAISVIERNSKPSEPEENSVPENSQEDAVKVKNSEFNNEIDLEEVVIPSMSQSEINNGIIITTNEKAKNNHHNNTNHNNEKLYNDNETKYINGNQSNISESINREKYLSRKEGNQDVADKIIIEENISSTEEQISMITITEIEESTIEKIPNINSGNDEHFTINNTENVVKDVNKSIHESTILEEIHKKNLNNHENKKHYENQTIPIKLENRGPNCSRALGTILLEGREKSKPLLPSTHTTTRNVTEDLDSKVVNEQNNANKEHAIPIILENLTSKIQGKYVCKETSFVTNLVSSGSTEDSKKNILDSKTEEHTIPIEIETSNLLKKKIQRSHQAHQTTEHEVPIQLENSNSTAANNQDKTSRLGSTLSNTEFIRKEDTTESNSKKNENSKIQTQKCTDTLKNEPVIKNDSKNIIKIINSNIERAIPIQLEERSNNSRSLQNLANIKCNREKEAAISNKIIKECIFPVKMETSNLNTFNISEDKEKETKKNREHIGPPEIVENFVKISQEFNGISIEKEPAETNILKTFSSNNESENKQYDERIIPVKVENSFIRKVEALAENIDNIAIIREDQNEKSKERKIPIELETKISGNCQINENIIQLKSNLNVVENITKIKDQPDVVSRKNEKENVNNCIISASVEKNIDQKFNEHIRERHVPIELENGSLNNKEYENKSANQLKNKNASVTETIAPTPPVRSTSLRQCNLSELQSEQMDFIEIIPSCLPIRYPDIIIYDSYFPFDISQTSQSDEIFDLEEQIELIEFIKILLTILSNHSSSRQDIWRFLSHYDLEKLPLQISCIIDDLMAPTSGFSSEVSTPSDGFIELSNRIYEVDNNKADDEIAIDKPPSDHEIAPIAEDNCQKLNNNQSKKEKIRAMSIASPQFSSNAVTPTDFQEEQQDSSSSTASISTTKYNAAAPSVDNTSFISETPTKDIADVKLGLEPSFEASPTHSRLKHLFLNSGEEEERESIISKNDSSHPISSTTLDDRLYYVPLDQTNFDSTSKNSNLLKFHNNLPNSLSDLCIKQILLMPGGKELIRELLIESKQISRNNLKASKEFGTSIEIKDSYSPINYRDLSRKKHLEIDQGSNHKTKTWTGVPTKDDPNLFVCFSPAQQKATVKTSVDNLLDLHKKFVNRRGYHHDHSQSISPPKYFIDVNSKEIPTVSASSAKDSGDSTDSPNVAKENPTTRNRKTSNRISSDDTRAEDEKGPPARDDNQERLHTTRLSDWLSLARRAPTASDSDASIKRGPEQRRSERTDKPTLGDSRPIDGAPIASTTPTLPRTPVTHRGAIVDESPRGEARAPDESGPPSAKARRYVNPALILADDKPEPPPRAKRIASVDRDCIDTRSIFDRGATSSSSKQATAVEIMKNLRQLRAGMGDGTEGGKGGPLPRDHFDKRLAYIERLESKLKEVVLAEEAAEIAEEKFKRDRLEEPCKIETTLSRSAPVAGDVTESNEEALGKNDAPSEDRGEAYEAAGTKLSRPTDKEEARSARDFRRLATTTPASAVATNGEVFRMRMYDEYVREVLEREERRSRRVVRISSRADGGPGERRGDDGPWPPRGLEREFIERARSRLSRHGIRLDESDEGARSSTGEDEPPRAMAKFLVDGREVRDARGLPAHLREFLRLSAQPAAAASEEVEKEEEEASEDEMIAPRFKASSAKPGVWSPGGDTSKSFKRQSPERGKEVKDEPIAPVWTPSSAGSSPVPERKEFRPVPFESPILSRKKFSQPAATAARPDAGACSSSSPTSPPPPPPPQSSSREEQRRRDRPRAAVQGQCAAPRIGDSCTAAAPRLPRAQNPTITLLQKAREGQLPKGAAYLDEIDHAALNNKPEEKPLLSPGEVIYTLKKEYRSEPEADNAPPKKMADLGPRKYEGIGPTTRGGVPIVLRSEVKENNQAKWYKRMYDSLHRAPKNDDYVTIRYKPHRGTRTGYSGTSSGYLSEPEQTRSYSERSATLDNRRHRQRNKENDYTTSTLPRPTGRIDGHYSPDTYHMQPGRIEDYVPGNCSIQEKETKEPPSDLTWAKRKWWDEVMDIFDRWLDENGPLQTNGGTNGSIAELPLLQRSSSARSALQSSDHQLAHRQQHRHQQQQQQRHQHPADACADRLSHSVSSSSNSSSSGGGAGGRSRSLRGPSPLQGRLYPGRRTSGSRSSQASGAGGRIRRHLELNDEQQRLRQSRLIESLFELAGGGGGSAAGPRRRPRSGSTGAESEPPRARIIRPLDGDEDDEDEERSWAYRGHRAVERHRARALSAVPPRGGAVAAFGQPLGGSLTINGGGAHKQQQQQPPPTVAPGAAAALSSSASSSSSVTNSSSNGTITSTNHVAPFEQSNTHSPKSYMTHALKESGYESDSTLVFRRREDASPLSPLEQRIAYKTVQKGGDVPLHGLRKPAPERPKDDSEIEYFPISRTLTRIRVHKKNSCSSTTASPTSSTSSMNISRIPVSSMASSMSKRSQILSKNNNPPLLKKSSIANVANPISVNGKIPSPPKRKSSRNNRTLKLYSNSGNPVDNLQNQSTRHEQCFVEEQISNVRLLKEKINPNLGGQNKDREDLQKQKFVRPLSVSPISTARRSVSKISTDSRKRKSEPCLSRKSCDSEDILSSRAKSRFSNSTSPVCRPSKVSLFKKVTEIKSAVGRSPSKASITSSSKDLKNSDQVSQHISRSKIPNSVLKKEQKIHKTKKDQDESCNRLTKSTTDLTSTIDLRRVIQRQKEKDKYPRNMTRKVLSSGTVIKSFSTPFTSSLGSSRLKSDEKSLNVKVAISSKGREILKKPIETKRKILSSKEKKFLSESSTDPKKNKVTDKTRVLSKVESRHANYDDNTKLHKELRTYDFSERISHQVSSKNSLRANSYERIKTSERMIKSEIINPTLTVDLLRQHQEATMSDSFFQHLFLRDILLTSSQPIPLQRSSVLERARMFQEIGYSDNYRSEPSLKSLSIYLAHKRPVSNSRFKNWERESLSSRSSSPYGLRSIGSRFNKFDSTLRVDEFGSASSLRGRSPDLTRECPKERSLSEPPLKTVRESSDCSSRRSQSPSPIRYPSIKRIQNLYENNLNNRNDLLQRKFRARSASEMDCIYGNEQNLGSNLSLTRSTNSLMIFPVDRGDYQHYILERLHSRPKSIRYKDLYDFYTSLERMGNLEKTASSSDLRPRLKNEEIIDYERWKQIRTKEKAEEELKNLYKKLKLVQKEKDFLFSTKDVDRYKWRGDSSLRCKERSVENIREQFRKLENKESGLEAIKQREIATKKDTYKPLWRGNSVVNVANTMTRKAAEKADFDRSSVQASLQRSLGGSTKFWSSLSIEQVTALKNQLNDIYGNDPIKTKKVGKSKISDIQSTTESITSENGILDSRVNHSVNIATSKLYSLRNSSSESEQSSISVSDYEIIVPKKTKEVSSDDGSGLHVRCHSMIAPERSRRSEDSKVMKRSGSISRVSSSDRSQSDRLPNSSPMSEEEKKRLSLTLGKEMLEKVSQRLASSMIKPRETRGALAAALAKSTPSVSPRTCSSIDAVTSDDTSKSKDKSNFLLVLTPDDDEPEQKERVEKVMHEWSKKPTVTTIINADKGGIDQVDSATESSDTSVKTVVRRSSECEDLQKKVEFYENIEVGKVERSRYPNQRCKLSSSQSFTDLKELFGESAAAKYRTIPLYESRSRSASPVSKAEQIEADSNKRGRSSSASPDVVASTRRPLRSCSRDRDEQRQQQQHQHQRARSVSPCRVASPTDYRDSSGSLESLWQRCRSPDPEKYWRTYLRLVRDGTVRRLRAKFESLEELPHPDRRRLALLPKRFQSDPELARNLLNKVTDTRKNFIKPQEISDVAWLRRKYEPPRGRRRRGRTSPIPRLTWKLGDLTMPHINVISKTAELKDSASRKPADPLARQEETRELEARRAVNRVREMFEGASSPATKTSILGEMFTSAPDVHELRDIAPYLAGRWVAHRYPSRHDNSRSLSSPADLSRGTSEPSGGSIAPPSRMKRPRSSRPASASPPARPRTPPSILKQHTSSARPAGGGDAFADQPFDPSKHRPRYRYQPTPPALPTPAAPGTRCARKGSWCPPIPTYSARPTVVTFEGSAAKRPPNA